MLRTNNISFISPIPSAPMSSHWSPSYNSLNTSSIYSSPGGGSCFEEIFLMSSNLEISNGFLPTSFVKKAMFFSKHRVYVCSQHRSHRPHSRDGAIEQTLSKLLKPRRDVRLEAMVRRQNVFHQVSPGISWKVVNISH